VPRAEVHLAFAATVSGYRSPAGHAEPPADIFGVLGTGADGSDIEEGLSVTAIAVTLNQVALEGLGSIFGASRPGKMGN
jgi:hypothetical protein